jgi:hypothetical protein
VPGLTVNYGKLRQITVQKNIFRDGRWEEPKFESKLQKPTNGNAQKIMQGDLEAVSMAGIALNVLRVTDQRSGSTQ